MRSCRTFDAATTNLPLTYLHMIVSASPSLNSPPASDTRRDRPSFPTCRFQSTQQSPLSHPFCGSGACSTSRDSRLTASVPALSSRTSWRAWRRKRCGSRTNARLSMHGARPAADPAGRYPRMGQIGRALPGRRRRPNPTLCTEMDRLADTLGALRVDVVGEIDVWQTSHNGSDNKGGGELINMTRCGRGTVRPSEPSTQLLHAFAGFFGEHQAGHEYGVPLGRAFATERRSRQTHVQVQIGLRSSQAVRRPALSRGVPRRIRCPRNWRARSMTRRRCAQCPRCVPRARMRSISASRSSAVVVRSRCKRF